MRGRLLPASAILALLWGSGMAAGAVVERGPYLQVATDTSVRVRWRTDDATDGVVRYGPSPDQLLVQVTDATVTTEHSLLLDGLVPQTLYYYSVGSSIETLAGDSSYHFRTSPSPGAEVATRVWIIGDSGTANSSARAVRDGYLSWSHGRPADLWLMLGDNAYSTGTDAQYQAAVFDTYPTILRNTPLWPTRGNHDQLHAGANNDYYEIFTLPTGDEAGGVASGTEAYYSFDYAETHFICLDSQGSDVVPPSVMLDWLELDLASTNRKWIVAFWHHPPYSQGSHNSDNLNGSETRLVEMRENVLPILEAGGVDLVLTGHSHAYERSFLLDAHYGYSWELADSNKVDDGDGRPEGDGAYAKPTMGPAAHDGAVYLVAGNGGQTSGGPLAHPVMIESQNILGSVILEIAGNQLEAWHLDSSGEPTDSFTIVKGGTVGMESARLAVGPMLRSGQPNPFRTSTRLTFTLPRPGPATLTVLDAAGRRVRTLADRSFPEGDHAVVWDGADDAGRRALPGVYFGILRFGGELRVSKLVLLE